MENNTMKFDTKNVFTAIVGRPNVGKSSLLNKLVGEKVAIVTAKPQTTRNKITGIITKDITQFIFMDTPGIHTARTKLGERMVGMSRGSIGEADVAVMVFEPYGELTQAEEKLIEEIKKSKLPAIAVINKTDTLKKLQDLVDRIEFINNLDTFEKVMETSAIEETGIEELLKLLENYAAEGPHYFPEDAYTDMPEKALVAEIIREKMLLNLYDETRYCSNC
ncbi:MAG: GTPase Era [Oscillospiraceae bacterium]